MRRTQFALLAIFASMAASAAELSRVPPPGEYPRLLFTRGDLPAIRERAATPVGRAVVAAARHAVYGATKAVVEQYEKKDPKWLDEQRKESRAGWGRFAPRCRAAAFLHLVSGDARDGWMAAESFRIWLSAWPPSGELKPEASWGTAEYALAYDWIHDVLTPDDRARAEAVFASMVGKPTVEMFAKEWWLDGPRASGRNTTNWTPICTSNLGLTNFVLEGRPGNNPALAGLCRTYMRAFLDEGIGPDGGMYEGTGYPLGFGTDHTPYYLAALLLRGDGELAASTHLPRVAEWLAYDMLPWGGEGNAHNQAQGHYGPGSFLTFIAARFGGLAAWVFGRSTDEWGARGGAVPNQMAVLFGLPDPASARPPDGLPLARWFSTVGLVYLRSGWGPRDAHLMFATNSSLGAGHSHVDQGSFCLASNGAGFFIDPGNPIFGAEEHNLVLIDGRGQASGQGCVEAFIRSVDSTGHADLIDADLKPSYDRGLVKTEKPPYFAWSEVNPVRRADRRVLFLRGASGPVVAVADDIRKDALPRAYTWLGHTAPGNSIRLDGRRFSIAERYGGRYFHTLERGRKTTLLRRNVPEGRYAGWLLMRSEPTPAAWASNNIRVNGKLVPYNMMYFGRGKFVNGWSWGRIAPLGKPEIDVGPPGELRVELESASGGRVAVAVFTRNAGWTPDDAPPADGGDFVVMGAADAQPGENLWPVGDEPKGVLDGVFLGEAPELAVGRSAVGKLPRLEALRPASSGARFLAVLVPHDEGDGRTVEVPADGGGRVAVVGSAKGTDILGGSDTWELTTGDLATNGRVAAVSLPPGGERPSAYAMADGDVLEYRKRRLVSVERGHANVLNDGRTVSIRAPGGAVVSFVRLGAASLTVNGTPAAMGRGDTVSVAVPVAPARWTVRVSPDGREVDVAGGGPLPLKVRAPKAVNVTVNGVSRFFVRDRDGFVHPTMPPNGPYPEREPD